jgi:hypothetical protein
LQRRLGLPQLFVPAEDGFLGAPELDLRLPEFIAERDDLRLPRVALGDRPLQIRLQRQAELLRGIELFLDTRQPIRRVGEL